VEAYRVRVACTVLALEVGLPVAEIQGQGRRDELFWAREDTLLALPQT